MSTLTHHGLIYVPLGYKTTFALQADLSEVHGGSAWGAGTYAVGHLLIRFSFAFDGSRRKLTGHWRVGH